MVDNKANALKEAKNQYKLIAYYEDEANPEKVGSSCEYGEILDKTKKPWLIKWKCEDGTCRQFVDTYGVYHKVSQDFAGILDAVIVNSKQREAVGKIVDSMLCSFLCHDLANEGDCILDPVEI